MTQGNDYSELRKAVQILSGTGPANTVNFQISDIKNLLADYDALSLKALDTPAPPSADVVERVAHAMASWDEWPQFRKNYEGIARAAIEAMKQLESKSHTGIDVADVVGKLSAGTHYLAPIEPDAAMLQTADDVLKAIYSDDHVRSEMSFMWMKVHRAVARAAMIRAAQEKP